MEDLIAYLDESLVPLEEKIKEYLAAEREIRLLEVKLLPLQHEENNPETESPSTPAAAHQHTLQQQQQQLDQLLQRYQTLRSDIVAMLPERNTYVEINLGYGPSMVGYFDIDPDTRTPLSEAVLRVVH